MMVETYWRRGQRSLQRLLLEPGVRGTGMVLLYGGSGFLLSASGLGNAPQPLTMGLIAAATGWRALVISLGAMLGYPAFWGSAGRQGIVWAGAAGLLALLLGKREEARAQPLMLPVIAAFLAGISGLTFQLLLREEIPPLLHMARISLTFLSGVLFAQASRCRDGVTDWLIGGVAVLALARVAPVPWLRLGYAAAGLAAVYGAFPAAVLAGFSLDLARVTPVPMAAVMCLACFAGMIPFARRWQRYAVPGAACIAVMAACGIRDLSPLPGLFLGGALGALLPPGQWAVHRRGETGMAQVRLELGAEVLRAQQRILTELELPPPDAQALVDKAAQLACAGCPARAGCTQRERLTLHHLEHPLDADCARQGRLLPELDRARDQLRLLKADRQRRGEYRAALVQQYRFLGEFLRGIADQLPRRSGSARAEFRVEVGARSRGKARTNGDRCLAFAGSGFAYYVLLCDGMGTGPGAALEGQSAGDLLRQMLCAGFPPEHALGTVNSLLALRGSAGAVTVDLAQIRLDTGYACLYKWGAAPSWVLTRGRAEKIGTAVPPPGLSVEGRKETVDRLSLRRGEVLVLLSDGVEAGEGLRLDDLAPDWPPGELAAKILERGCGTGEDDATAAVVRLVPVSLEPS